MAEPTLKDVLEAIARLRTETSADLVAVRSDIAALRSDVDGHRSETRKGFTDLDKELAGHAALHREIEKDIEALKARPARTAARATRRPRTR